jgi:predicted MFS family arabinose efflux permease
MSGQRHAAIRFIVALGIVSLFADMTYEGARSILGPFLQNLGASAAEVGAIAGFGEMIAAGLRFFSGRLADRSRAYWTFTFFGYALSVLSVPLLAFALGWPMAAALVIAERTGKSLRGPARDVLLSQATGHVGHGWGFGLHTALDQTGAVLGPLLVAAIMATDHHFGPALLWLGAPALATMIALTAARALNPPDDAAPAPPSAPRTLPRVFWIYVAAAGLVAFGFIDFPLLAFHFQNAGVVRSTTIPLLYAGAMAVNGLSALVFGKLFDRFGITVLAAGVVLSMAALPLGFGGSAGLAAASVICWGCGMGVQDACLRPGIARVVSMDKRGRAFGLFSGVYGILWFAGSALMGLLYNQHRFELVAIGMAAQLAGALIFLWLGRKGLLESNRT